MKLAKLLFSINHRYKKFLLRLLILVVAGLFVGSGDATADNTNGFDLTNTSIPREEIFHGGPAKDEIKSLDAPKFAKAGEADYLSDDDRIIGIVIDDVAKAYPIRIMNWHEVVNDSIKGQSFAVTYSPLCASGRAFSSDVKGEKLIFGVSGLLNNSNLLFYDRKTESLWSQIMGVAISGHFKGTKLKSLPTEHTTWKAWKKRHPKTVVLTSEGGMTGRNKKAYEINPFGYYEKSEQLYFEVTNEAPADYHPKKRVLGLNANGVYKAYPFIELNTSSKKKFIDKVNGVEYLINWDQENNSANVTDKKGKPVPTIEAYWFVWYAFHPDTLVFKGGK